MGDLSVPIGQQQETSKNKKSKQTMTARLSAQHTDTGRTEGAVLSVRGEQTIASRGNTCEELDPKHVPVRCGAGLRRPPFVRGVKRARLRSTILLACSSVTTTK